MTAIVLIVCVLLALLASFCAGNQQSSRLRTVHQFPSGTWVENVAIRSNGNLLVTLVNTPELWEINPFAPYDQPQAKRVHHFKFASMATGITELEADQFAVIAPNSVYTFNFSDTASISDTANVTPRLIANMTAEAGSLNGMTTWNAGTGDVLIADSTFGAIWRLNVHTKQYRIVLQDDTMSARQFRRIRLGINGIKVAGEYVYYNNCPGELFCRVLVDNETAQAVGPYEVVAQGVLADDFAITSDQTAYLAGLDDNVVVRVLPNGTSEVVAGSRYSVDLIGATAAAFGRTDRDKTVLYVTTGGGSGEGLPINGTYIEGGKIVAIQL